MSSRTVLLVEDNEDDIELTTHALHKANTGIAVEFAHDGVEVLEYLLPSVGLPADERPLPAVVLLDLKLPRVGGLEVLQRLRADPRTRFLPVVILTSSGHPRDKLSSYSLGCNSYVRKPVDSARFFDMIKHLALYWIDMNERVEEL